MNVIAKISCYFERRVVTLKLRKEYLNTVTYNTPVLLRIKYWTVWYIERYFMSTYTGVTNFWKQSGFFGPPCIFFVCVAPHIAELAHGESSVVRGYQPSVTELFRLLRLVSGTVYHSTSHPRSHCQSSSAVALRHISSGAASRDYVVVPEKWHRHFRTCESFFLLTYPHCWASPWRKIAYSISHSLNHSLTQLIWCPGNRSFRYGMSGLSDVTN